MNKDYLLSLKGKQWKMALTCQNKFESGTYSRRPHI